jgi:hypothetical protein
VLRLRIKGIDTLPARSSSPVGSTRSRSVRVRTRRGLRCALTLGLINRCHEPRGLTQDPVMKRPDLRSILHWLPAHEVIGVLGWQTQIEWRRESPRAQLIRDQRAAPEGDALTLNGSLDSHVRVAEARPAMRVDERYPRGRQPRFPLNVTFIMQQQHMIEIAWTANATGARNQLWVADREERLAEQPCDMQPGQAAAVVTNAQVDPWPLAIERFVAEIAAVR